MIQLGAINSLLAYRQTDNGVYLIDENSNEVLLPNKYVPVDMRMGDSIDVFVFKDSDNRITAVTTVPKILLNQFVALEAKTINKVGAFFDWGLDKDLLVPYSQQSEQIYEGEFYVVYMYHDEVSDRLVGTTKISNILSRDTPELSVGDEVDIIPFEEIEIGISVIVNNMYQGILYKNEIFEEIKVGDTIKGFVKKIREDNKIDIDLNRFGYRKVDDNIEKIIDALNDNSGQLNLNDKSSPEYIYSMLGMSKKVFKKSIGALYKDKKITISDDGINLITKKEEA